MAALLWGKVFYNEQFAGILEQEPGERYSFTYDKQYLATNSRPISYTMPCKAETYTYTALPAFFDNLVAEGWLEEAQTRVLGKRQVSRFEHLLAFGQDCAGAISVIDPSPSTYSELLIDKSDPREIALLTNRASLSGVQPKLTVQKKDDKYFPTKVGETSTYIAKFPSNHHNDLVINEYLSTLAYKALLPEDTVVEMHIGEIHGFSEQALIIKRFDRTLSERIHFEEFNQLLGYSSFAKYDGDYQDMSQYMYQTEGCLPVEVYRLYQRIIAGLLLGNTDMHFKNFAMFHTKEGLRLTPSYDIVCAALYQYKTVALAIHNTANLQWGSLKANHLVRLGEDFKLSRNAILMACEEIGKNKEAAKEKILNAKWGSITFKDQLITHLEKRWNGTFASIGQALSKKQ